MEFVRAERDDRPLRLWVVTEMLPYFFAARHKNYATHGLCYLRSTERLHGDIVERFMKGDHVTCHKKCLWKGILLDMYIESTFMRYDHGPHGIVGIKMKPSALKKWAYTCSQIVHDHIFRSVTR